MGFGWSLRVGRTPHSSYCIRPRGARTYLAGTGSTKRTLSGEGLGARRTSCSACTMATTASASALAACIQGVRPAARRGVVADVAARGVAGTSPSGTATWPASAAPAASPGGLISWTRTALPALHALPVGLARLCRGALYSRGSALSPPPALREGPPPHPAASSRLRTASTVFCHMTWTPTTPATRRRPSARRARGALGGPSGLRAGLGTTPSWTSTSASALSAPFTRDPDKVGRGAGPKWD